MSKAFIAEELGYATDSQEMAGYRKVALGLWGSSAKFSDIEGKDRSSNGGFYAIAEKTLLTEADNQEAGLGAFVQLGFAPGDRNRSVLYWGTGLNYKGLISCRPEDETVFGIAQVRNSDQYLDTEPSDERAETAIELGHKLALTEKIALQPDLQFVLDPNTNPDLDTAVVFTTRLAMEF